MTHEPSDLERAQQCRRLADAINDKEVVARLLELALQYEAQAAAPTKTTEPPK
jgi:hypothetical protein